MEMSSWEKMYQAQLALVDPLTISLFFIGAVLVLAWINLPWMVPVHRQRLAQWAYIISLLLVCILLTIQATKAL